MYTTFCFRKNKSIQEEQPQMSLPIRWDRLHRSRKLRFGYSLDQDEKRAYSCLQVPLCHNHTTIVDLCHIL